MFKIVHLYVFYRTVCRRQHVCDHSFGIPFMNNPDLLRPVLALLPLALMLMLMVVAWLLRHEPRKAWSVMVASSALASLVAMLSLALNMASITDSGASTVVDIIPGLAIGVTGAWLALLVQGLGTVIGAFSSRYLEGESGQIRYIVAFAGVLAGVQLLVLADHWAILIAAWAAVGLVLNSLLCFYSDRPFATLAAYKKFLADRIADVLLIGAAWLAIHEVDSASISLLLQHVDEYGASTNLQISAALIALAVVIRMALLPVHGWLIQVMEAPTPVSALLHAGVINLGGYILILFAPLFEAAPAARSILMVVGLLTAMLAGFVMLTRISIKVRLAWSTSAQMGFLALECALGLYQLAVLHLIGHSLYKAHAFLSSGDAVRQARLSDLRGAPSGSTLWSLATAPLLVAVPVFVVIQMTSSITMAEPWPWWWSMVLAFAWAPMLWLPAGARSISGRSLSVLGQRIMAGTLMVTLLTVLAVIGHALPVGVTSVPHAMQGHIALAAMALIYIGTAMLQMPGWRHRLEPLRQQCYAGFYLDEAYTRLALRLWPLRLPSTHQARDTNSDAAGFQAASSTPVKLSSRS
jgi:NAD(P)H-quinone oxidoreductase subunit 5